MRSKFNCRYHAALKGRSEIAKSACADSSLRRQALYLQTGVSNPVSM
jgi:hypothetical protein